MSPHRVKVKVGIRDGQDAQITDGLQGGERVVTVGAFELDQEDEDVLAKTKVQVQAPKMPEEEEDGSEDLAQNESRTLHGRTSLPHVAGEFRCKLRLR